MKKVSDACYEAEKALNVNGSNSRLSNGATSQGVIRLLSEKGSILSLFDEAGAWLSTLNRTPQNPAGDRAIYLELFNCPAVYNRNLQSGGIRIESPRLNLCILSHPELFIKMIGEELELNNDGMSHRFLTVAPPAVDASHCSLIDVASKVRPSVSLACFFYTLAKAFETQIDLKFGTQTLIKFDTFYMMHRRIVQLANDVSNIFIR